MTTDPLLLTLSNIASFLENERIAFALIGGLAVSVRGEPRSTLDVDLIIDGDVDCGLRLLKNLDLSVFRPLFAGVEQVVRTGLLLPLTHLPTGLKVDLALAMSGFEKEAISEATQVDLVIRSIPVVRAEHLVLMKFIQQMKLFLIQTERLFLYMTKVMKCTQK